jgi:hypothetical protein
LDSALLSFVSERGPQMDGHPTSKEHIQSRHPLWISDTAEQIQLWDQDTDILQSYRAKIANIAKEYLDFGPTFAGEVSAWQERRGPGRCQRRQDQKEKMTPGKDRQVARWSTYADEGAFLMRESAFSSLSILQRIPPSLSPGRRFTL